MRALLLTLSLLLPCGTVRGQVFVSREITAGPGVVVTSNDEATTISVNWTIQLSDLIVIRNYASASGIVAPGGLAQITGDFSEGSFYYNQAGDLPKELGGVVVAIDGELCGLRMVEPHKIVATVPQFPIRAAYRFGWKVVEVKTADGRLLTGWTVVRPVAPGIVMERDSPQGLWHVPGTEVVGVIEQSDVPRGATLALTGSGFGRARFVTAFLMTDTAWFAVVAKVGPFAVPMEGLETVSFDLPPQITGEVTVILAADGAWSNEVRLVIARPVAP